jgi:hypothetical protein
VLVAPKANTCDRNTALKTLGEILVRRLNTLALDDLTNGAWFEKQNNYYTPFLPITLSAELEAIDNPQARRECFDRLTRPFSIGAASIDYGDMEIEDGAAVPEHVTDQLRNIDSLIDMRRIEFSGSANGREFKMQLIFQIHPILADFDEKKRISRSP